MAKRILTLCLALVVGLAFAMPASAAVKSIKVGGDLTIRGIYRDNMYFMNEGSDDSANSWLTSTTRVWVGAELTDNVSAVIRLLNERDWSSFINSDEDYEGQDINIDLSYVKLSDVLTPGLTATIGRQEILLGEGFVVGNVNGVVPFDVLSLRDRSMTAKKAFDAWRLDYEVGVAPVTVTLFDAKIFETAGLFYSDPNCDFDLWGLNVAYAPDNVTIEGYYLLLDAQTGDEANLSTYGARVDHTVLAVPGLNYNVEGAMQSGDLVGEDMEGWAGNADVSYTFQNPMEPKIGAAWYYASGDENGEEDWIPLFPDNLGDRLGRIFYSSMVNNMYDLPGTNISVPKIYASMKPAEKHTLSLAYFPASTVVSTDEDDDDLGYEIDLGYTYQYTEDVALGLCLDYASAGKYYDYSEDESYQVIGTVALSF